MPKISSYSTATTLTGTELIPIVQSGASKSATPNLLIGSDPANLNLVIGEQALKDDKGQQNVALGYLAGLNNSHTDHNDYVTDKTGTRDVYIGYAAGQGSTAGTKNTGYYNVFIGAETGNKNTTGYQNTFIGLKSGYLNTTGSCNTAIGMDSLDQNMVGVNNVAIGDYAGYNNIASSNVFVGHLAGSSNTTGTQNVIIGSNAANGANANPVQCVLIGLLAGNLTTGTGSVMIGSDAGENTTSGGANVFVGLNAGNTNVTGMGNTYIGTHSGKIATGGTNIYIGYCSGWKQVAQNNTFMVDNQERNDQATGQANALFYGTMASTAAAQTLHINARVVIPQITAALTDGTPTDAEIDTATGLTGATAGAGYQCTIKDNSGTGLIYRVECDGANWYYQAGMTKAL